MVESFAVAEDHRKVEVQSPGHREGVAVFKASRPVYLFPKVSARFAAKIAFAAGLEVVCEQLSVDSDVMLCERFVFRCLA